MGYSGLSPPDPPGSPYMVVSQNRGTPIYTLIYYNPEYGDPQKGTPNFGKPLTWKPKKGPIKRKVPSKRGYMGFHVSLEECIPSEGDSQERKPQVSTLEMCRAWDLARAES